MPEGDITGLLRAFGRGDAAALESLIPLVYQDLKRIARVQLGRSGPGQTLQPTALVHEAYLRLVDQTQATWRDRAHFLAVAARAMRQIIIDHARRRSAVKRGGGRVRLSLDRAQLAVADQAQALVEIDDALRRLSALNDRLTRVFECRFFAGLSEKETAAALDVPLRTVQRDWMKSKAWLRRELASPQAAPTP